MSEENVELVRRFFDLRLQGDKRALELLAEDVIYLPIAEITEAGEYRGREGFQRYVDRFFDESWSDDLTYGATSFRAYGDKVIVRVQFAGHGRASGIDLSFRVFEVFTVQGQRIAHVEDFIDRSEAIEAPGLRR